MFLIGRLEGFASVIKFTKSSFNIHWKVTIGNMDNDPTHFVYSNQTASNISATHMTEILSVVQPQDSDSLWCAGYAYRDSTDEDSGKYAVVFKMDQDGEIKFLYKWGQYTGEPWYDTQQATIQDVARAINYDDRRKEIVVMMEVTSPDLRPDYSKYKEYSSTSSDILIVTIKTGGQIMSGYNINMDKADIGMKIGDGALFVLGSQYVFGGQSWGFKTIYQNVTYNTESPTFDSYLFKYNPLDDNECFYTGELSRSKLTASTVFQQFKNSEVQNKTTNTRNLFKQMNNIFIAYQSRYSGAFPLLDTFKYPKMCAQQSLNLTNGVEYYRGQNRMTYVISEESPYGSVVSQMDRGQTWLF
jgi:hypothetical protein